MNGGTIGNSTTTTVPLQRPTTAPTPIATRMVTHQSEFPQCWRPRAPTQHANAMIDPTDKSIPPAIITQVEVTAIIPTTAVVATMARRFDVVRNVDRRDTKTAPTIMITAIMPVS